MKTKNAYPDEPCSCPYCIHELLDEEETGDWDDSVYEDGACVEREVVCNFCKEAILVRLITETKPAIR